MTKLIDSPAPLAETERGAVARLFRQAERHYLNLDWRSLDDGLRDPALCCRVARQGGVVTALVGASLYHPGTAPGVAWVRFILPAAPGDCGLLGAVWDALADDLRAQGVRQVAILATEAWVRDLAAKWGFERTNAVITLRRARGPIPPPPAPPLAIREVRTHDDLTAVAHLDALAFAPLWQYSQDTLAVAQQNAATFTMLQAGSRLLGYQLSTRHPGSGHLARLAVRPDAQGRGLAALLVGEMLRFMQARGVWAVTVNTQEDNLRSQRLYARLGFDLFGDAVPVWTLDL